MILVRSRDPHDLSNAYLVGDREGGTAIVVDTGAPLPPLLEALERSSLTLAAVLCTHRHGDHVSGNHDLVRRTGAPVFTSRVECPHVPGAVAIDEGRERAFGSLVVRPMPLPGHTAGQVGYEVEGVGLFTGDCLFRGSLGGTVGAGSSGFDDARNAVLRILALPDPTVLHPGHGPATTVGEERATNPFIRAMLGEGSPTSGRCTALGRPAELIVLARDYDGGTKAWVRFDDDDSDAIVPGSRVVVS
jgi:glyoxylase-like metal-dependent hydrolase (beta-lactamase superfamily II)